MQERNELFFLFFFAFLLCFIITVFFRFLMVDDKQLITDGHGDERESARQLTGEKEKKNSALKSSLSSPSRDNDGEDDDSH